MGIGWLDPGQIIGAAGASALWITLGIVFAECGLLLGFFLPGDTLLFSVGVLSTSGVVPQSIWVSCLVLAAGAVLGNVCGYEIGRRAGPNLLSSDRVRIIKPHHLERTEAFFERHGAQAIIGARFVPIVRTLITVIAGIARMDRRRYFALSAIGGVVWVFSITLLGYFLGDVPLVRDYIEPHLDLVILAIVLASVIPALVHLLLDRRRGHRAASGTAADPEPRTAPNPGSDTGSDSDLAADPVP